MLCNGHCYQQYCNYLEHDSPDRAVFVFHPDSRSCHRLCVEYLLCATCSAVCHLWVAVRNYEDTILIFTVVLTPVTSGSVRPVLLIIVLLSTVAQTSFSIDPCFHPTSPSPESLPSRSYPSLRVKVNSYFLKQVLSPDYFLPGYQLHLQAFFIVWTCVQMTPSNCSFYLNSQFKSWGGALHTFSDH